ncbi:MAG: hypothetical protein KAV87_04930 [Desulfobacteraceae bacterium]|nr:hypothetical protein [Desulfobacteraceae bacterium]
MSYRHKGVESSPWDKNGVFWGSGRDAFRALLLHGRAARSWRRLWIPSYFCQEVVLSLMSTGIEVAVYPDNPVEYTNGIDKIEVRPGHVILIVNFFGLRVKKQRPQYECQHVEIIEDHTHDPWSTWAWSSNADWCVVSLRKTLPVSDGGVLWSPVGQRLPPVRDVTAERRTASSYKLAAMLLKKLYLEGAPVSKEAYRRLAHFGEQHIASGEASGMAEWTPALLPTFPISA